MTGSCAHLNETLAKCNSIAMLEKQIRALGAAGGGKRDTAAQAPLKEPRASHMIGVHMGLQSPIQTQPQFIDQRRVAPYLFKHRIDQQGLAADRITQQVGVGRGLRIEKLPEDQHYPSLSKARKIRLALLEESGECLTGFL